MHFSLGKTLLIDHIFRLAPFVSSIERCWRKLLANRYLEVSKHMCVSLSFRNGGAIRALYFVSEQYFNRYPPATEGSGLYYFHHDSKQQKSGTRLLDLELQYA